MDIIIKPIGIELDDTIKAKLDSDNMLKVDDGTSLEQVVKNLKISPEIQFSYMLNGNFAQDDIKLKPMDEIMIMCMLYGG